MKFISTFMFVFLLKKNLPILITVICLACTSLAYGQDSLIFAGFSFVGQNSENQERYPYAAELSTQKTENGMPVLDSALQEIISNTYQRSENLIYHQKDVDSGTSLGLAFGLSQESIEKVGWKGGNLYIYQVLAQIMVFDFEQNLLLANFPVMLQHQELDDNLRDTEAHKKVFRRIYLGIDDNDTSIFKEWVTRLNSIEIKECYPLFLKVRDLNLDPELLKQLPEDLSPATYTSEVVQLFETILSKEQNVSMVPYIKGQVVGAKMPMTFNDARVVELVLPDGDFLFDIDLEAFKYLMKNDGNCHKHAFGAFATIKLSLCNPTNPKLYLEQRFKKINFAVFSAADNVDVDIWHSQQTSLKSLFVGFSQQISKKDKKTLSGMVENPKTCIRQLIEVEEKMSKCR